jgi:hypothetical protein
LAEEMSRQLKVVPRQALPVEKVVLVKVEA